MDAVWALVPVKSLAHAKSRLAPALDPAERVALAGHMARDVLTALRHCPGITGIALLAADDSARALAEAFGCRMLADDPALDLAANLQAAVGALAAAGARTVIIVPTDLPTLIAADIESLLARSGAGVTVVPAAVDGGTNALALTPPGAGACLFGPDSARRHLEAARQRGAAAQRLELPAFARDVDSVDDVLWLCSRKTGGSAWDYLNRSGICARLRQQDSQRTA